MLDVPHTKTVEEPRTPPFPLENAKARAGAFGVSGLTAASD
jgi:hypothetical protein